MEVRSLRQRWRDGATTLGAWISLRDPLLAEVAGQAGFDYVVVDMQHGLNDYADVVAMLQAMAGSATVPLVRVPWNEQGIIGRVLDAGALGVIIPMVNTADEARRAVDGMPISPDGTRSIGPLVARIRYGLDYPSIANEAVACIPMIETRQAVEGIDEILAVPGIDAVYVGPADLSMSYGLAPRVDQQGELFDSALAEVVDACRRHRRDARDPRQHLTRRQAPRGRLPHDHRRLRRRPGVRRLAGRRIDGADGDRRSAGLTLPEC